MDQGEGTTVFGNYLWDRNSDDSLCLVVHAPPRNQKSCKLEWNPVQIGILTFLSSETGGCLFLVVGCSIILLFSVDRKFLFCRSCGYFCVYCFLLVVHVIVPVKSR